MGKITYFIGQRWWHSVTHDPKIVGSNPKGGTGREKIAKNTLVSCQRGQHSVTNDTWIVGSNPTTGTGRAKMEKKLQL